MAKQDRNPSTPKKENLHEDHRQRMRARFEENGFAGWAPHEVLEFMLFYVFTRRNTNDIAHQLLRHSGDSMRQLFVNSEIDVLKEIEYVSDKTVYFLRALRGFVDFYHSEVMKERSIQLNRNTVTDVVRYFGFDESYEDIIMLCLDNQLRIKYVTRVAESRDDVSATLSEHKILRIAAETKAANVVFIHNHPSGNPYPSIEDVEMTINLERILSSINVCLADHYILSGNRVESIKMRMRDFDDLAAEDDIEDEKI